MKTLLAFVVSFLFFTSSANAQGRTDREQANLIGPVKSVEAYLIHYVMKDGKTEEAKRKSWYSATYNIDGNITERVSYDNLGNVSAKYLHTYNPSGRCIGYEEYSAILDNTLTIPRKHIYTLDDNGNRLEYKIVESNGTSAVRFTYKYDTKGNKIEESYYSHTGRLSGKSVYTYDQRGNQTSQIAYGADGSVHWKAVSIFDDEGNRIEWRQYEGDTLRYRIISRYDEKRRLLEEETMEFNAVPNVFRSHAPVPGKVVYAYDNEKRTKEVATYKPDESLKDRVVYSYDDKWNEVGLAMFKSDGSPKDHVISFYDNINEQGSKLLGSLTGKSLVEFEYDSRGNWTRKTSLIQSGKGGKPQRYHAEERVITYH